MPVRWAATEKIEHVSPKQALPLLGKVEKINIADDSSFVKHCCKLGIEKKKKKKVNGAHTELQQNLHQMV